MELLSNPRAASSNRTNSPIPLSTNCTASAASKMPSTRVTTCRPPWAEQSHQAFGPETDDEAREQEDERQRTCDHSKLNIFAGTLAYGDARLFPISAIWLRPRQSRWTLAAQSLN